jgi:cytoskeleton protein RodZ
MESLGQKLREAREQHNYSLEQVARDTHISKQYLEALEKEDFSTIPGETYVIGFLRNYAEYLSLNPEELVTLYKNIQIQEQPLPMTELLEHSGPRLPSRLIVVAVLVLAVLGGGGYLLYRFLASQRQQRAEPEAAMQPAASAAARESQGEEFIFQDEAVTRWFNLEDTIGVPLNGDTFPIQLTAIGRDLTMNVPGGSLQMTVGQDRQVDLNADGRSDLRILLNDLDVTDVAKRASLSLYKITKPAPLQVAQAGQGEQGEPAQAGAGGAGAPAPAGAAAPAEPASAAVNEQAASAPAAGQAQAAPETGQESEAASTAPVPPGTAPARQTPGVITVASAEAPSPFRVSISFRGYCLFRYLVDKNIREERFFHKGESFSLDANNEVQLWISNAGVVRLMVSGREIDTGRPGAVTTKQIIWTREESTGQYQLQVLTRE